MNTHDVFYANTPQNRQDQAVSGEYVRLLGEDYYCIRQYDKLDPFFMTIISASNHWLFISTTGGLTAGRIDANHALFPYYTDEKVTENSENTGSKTIVLLHSEHGRKLWEPFSAHFGALYAIERNIYKNISGTSLVFEEINHDLGLTFRYALRNSDKFGWVKTSYLINHGDSTATLEIVDGFQNLLPAHVNSDIQNVFSNLLDAYKMAELHAQTGIAMYSLSSRLTDLAEPSESLRTNTVWQVGLKDVKHLLSSVQLNAFRSGKGVSEEDYIRGKRGAYFINSTLTLQAKAQQSWHFVAEVNQDTASTIQLVSWLTEQTDSLYEAIEADIRAGLDNLETIIGSADGLQVSADNLSTAHHFANVLFNVMRGGIFVDNNEVEVQDLKQYIGVHNAPLLQAHSAFFDALAPRLAISALREKALETQDMALVRLCYSYLPLTFSRRHGDPSRPWNRFQINVKQADGSRKLDYQGNWRDIFQNWEALAYSYPEFLDGMISGFLNATTVDGYNPYRVTRNGIDWEAPEPSNAWANIGYWNDHQIIYLQKLLEASERFYPGKLGASLTQSMFSYANVPYQIKPYAEILQNPYDTITFDWDKEKAIEQLVHRIGADGKLVHDPDGHVLHVNLAEKLLSLLLAKLVNYVPEGGIWLNTQRPEWNDANNALVGKGISVVTLSYVRRYIAFCIDLFGRNQGQNIAMSQGLVTLLQSIHQIFASHQSALSASFDDQQRRSIMDNLGTVGTEYRWKFYREGLSNDRSEVSSAEIVSFLELAQAFVEHALRANKRADNLYHSYNVLHFGENTATVSYLSEMLEGQVAILSAGLLSAEDSLALLKTLRHSALYRADQHSYILYPDKALKGFLEKNNLPKQAAEQSKLIQKLVAANDLRLILRDVNGDYHFQGELRNALDVSRVLQTLAKDANYTALVAEESKLILDIFEEVFHHAGFTGRSGTFFAYEGLGSIYWHMISKLLLAVQEVAITAYQAGVSQDLVRSLIESYYDVRAGIGFNKSPDVYGAFPTDPYSHTPAGQGAKQPGMTGMVKEEILTRLVELGIFVEQGMIRFDRLMVRSSELLQSPSVLNYLDIHGKKQSLELPKNSLGFTICQVPVVLQLSNSNQIQIERANGTVETLNGHEIPASSSQEIYARNGAITKIVINFSQ